MNPDRYCVIMAGGIGSRFWPLSRNDRPKQFLDILGTGKSFIRHTYERFAGIIPTENFLVVTSIHYKSLVLTHIPELNEEQILCEPLRRNTAPCIAYAAYKIRKKNPEASMVVTPADHLILNENEFSRAVIESLGFAESHSALVTIGIQPCRPDTGYGYIQYDTERKNGSLYPVRTFTEKPTLDVALAFIESGDFLWNSGIFLWTTRSIVEAFEKYLPELDQQFKSVYRDFNTPTEEEAIRKIFPECRNISIDYGIMEKAGNVYVRPSEFGWSDIGTWGSLYSFSERDNAGNSATENTVLHDSKNCIIRIPKDKIAVVQGLDGYIVVESENALLICRKENEQQIRQYLEDVKIRFGEEYI